MIEGMKINPQLIAGTKYKENFTVAYCRNGIYEPYEYMVTWRNGNVGYLGVANVSVPNAISTLYEFFDINHITLCMDGQWSRINEGFMFTTQGPLISCTYNDKVRIYKSDYSILAEIGGSYIGTAIVRGWKSLINDDDMGIIIAAYTDCAIDVYSIVLYNDEYACTLIQSIEDTNISNVTLNVMYDYRLYMSITSDNSRLLITDRLYIAGAVKPDTATISAYEAEYTSSNTYIETTQLKSDNAVGKISVASTSVSTESSMCVAPSKIVANNIGDSIIKISFDVLIRGDLNLAHLSIKASSIPLTPLSATLEGNILTINCAKFNNYLGDFTITYSGDSLTLDNGSSYNYFSVSFTPAGLVPDEIEPPVVINIYNKELI